MGGLHHDLELRQEQLPPHIKRQEQQTPHIKLLGQQPPHIEIKLHSIDLFKTNFEPQ